MAEPTNYSAHYQQQQAYDPSSLTQQYYEQSANYSYPYANPQYANVQPYPYPNLTVQPSQQEAQEPNPPGVTGSIPAAQQGLNYYYQYQAPDAAAAALTGGSQQGGVDPSAVVVHQPILQSSYGAIGLINSIAPQGGVQTPVGPRPKAFGRPYRGRGRGRGRGQHKHAATPAQDQAIFVQGGPHIQGGPPQPMPESYAPSFGPIPMPLPTPMPFQGPAHSVPALPPSRIARCELCRVDCNSLEILEQHKNGKKHKKKLKVFEDLQKTNQRASGQPMELTSTSEVIPEVPSRPDQIEGSANQQVPPETLPSQLTNEESKVAVENPKVEEVEPTEESETKATSEHSEGPARGGFKRKMRGGKVGRRIKPYGRPQRLVEPPKPKEVIPLVCELCNVKCESTVVFQSHLVGKKHLAKAKRFMSQHEALGQVVLQALQQFSANASTSIAPHLLNQGFGMPQSASALNAKPIDVQASTSETNVESVKVEAANQPQALPANFEAENLVNAAEKSEEDVPAGTQPAASGSALGEASAFEQSALPVQETKTEQVQSDGTNQEP